MIGILIQVDQFGQALLLSFVPLFVAMDAVGTLAIITPLTQDMSRRERSRVAHIAMLTAGGLGVIFLFLGKIILGWLGIAVGHFAIAGGLILLVLSIKEMATGKSDTLSREEMIAVVPIGTPLISGPAVLTTLLLLSNQYQVIAVLVAFLINVLLGWMILLWGSRVVGFLGQGGTKAVSKIASLFLGAIAIKMIIAGLELTLLS